MAKRENKNGAAETSSEKVGSNLRALKKHIGILKKFKEKAVEITALKKAGVPEICDTEIEKAKSVMRQMLEKELNDL